LDEQNFTYQSIKEPSTGIFKDKGSKFLAFAYPISSEDQIKPKIDLLRKEYFDARHHCYAYRFGINGEIFRINDDGEPSGTAGKPILGQILSFNLTNVLVVIVRYFGGTLLGTGGLIKAYKTATFEALSNASIITCQIYEVFQVKFNYLEMNKVMKAIKDFDLEITKQNFGDICTFLLKTSKKRAPEFLKRLEPFENIEITKADDK
jgi:uncharacterized YigZ family protein